MKPSFIYLDHNATTPLRPNARDAMLGVLDAPGNASSVHGPGRAARKCIEDARAQVAEAVGAKPAQVIFNGGATEGNNTILRGFAPGRILVGATEHASILIPGADVGASKIPVTTDGVIDLEAFEKLLGAGPTGLVSVMAVNNETGVINPVAEIARLAHAYGAVLHVDAAQALGKIPVDMNAWGADFITLSAHKIGGPQGVGALVTADGSRACIPAPVLLRGGGQEKSFRAGTENVAGIVGFGAAATTVGLPVSIQQWRDEIEGVLRATRHDIVIHGQDAPRADNTICFSIPGVDAQTMLMKFDLHGVALSSGSACSSGVVKPSHVLLAMGVTADVAASSLRLSMGWNTTRADIDGFVDVWHKVMKG